MKAWLFSGEISHNSFLYNKSLPPIGDWEEYIGLEVNDLFASKKPSEALIYANGPFIHYLECDGKIIEEGDRFTCTRRRILKTKDVAPILRRYAKDQALKVTEQWSVPQIIKDYLNSDNESLRDIAWSTAWDCHVAAQGVWYKEAALATWYAAGTAAWYAARSAGKAVADALNQDTSEEFDNRIYKLFDLKK